jgi:hypothetical protein
MTVGIDAFPLLASAPPAPTSSTVFVADIAASPALIEALLAEKLLEALVVTPPPGGTDAVTPAIVAETPQGSITIATDRTLPPAARLLLRPAAEPGRAIVTVLPARATPARPASPADPRAPVAIDIAPRLPARVIGPSLLPRAVSLPTGAAVTIEILAIEPPETAAPETAAPESAAPESAASEPSLRAQSDPPAKLLPADRAAGPLRAAVPSPPATAESARKTDAVSEPVPSLDAQEAAPPPQGAASAAPPAKPAVTPGLPLRGVIIASAQETIVDTPIGRLALPIPLNADAGSTVLLAVVRSGATPNAAAMPDETALPREATARLADAFDVARAAAPAPLHALAAALQPSAGPPILAALLLFASATRGRPGEGWRALADAVAAAGAASEGSAILDAVASAQTTTVETPGGPFQSLLIPMMEGDRFRPLTLYWPAESERRRIEADGSQRFGIELELSRLGAVQLDGLVRPRRFDLVLRSRTPLAPALRSEIAAAFRDSLAASGLAGEIAFATTASFPFGTAAPRRPVTLSV